MLFNFDLTPLEEVVPWGPPGKPSLSWFGLTDGQYWIEAGPASLFEYSEHARRAGAPRYCDYQVIRLLEDILAMLPAVLEPVPPRLVEYLSGDAGRHWQCRFAAWSDARFDNRDENEYCNIVEYAQALSYPRFLDSAYLSPSASILMWSDEKNVHIEWNNSDAVIDGGHAWSAVKGAFQLPREDFLREIRSFHARLIEQMGARVGAVMAGALRPDIRVDIPGLIAEHAKRRNEFDCALDQVVATPWNEVERAIMAVSRE